MSSTKSRGVQGHDVARAADELIAQGIRPTIERVRLQMGRGSPNTIAPLLDQWFSELAPRLGLSAAQATETTRIPAQLTQAMTQIWQQAQQQAEEQAQAAWQERQGHLSEKEAALHQAQEQLQRSQQHLQERENAWQRTLEQLEQDLLHWKDQAQRAQSEHERVQHESQLLNQRLSEASAQVLLSQRRHEDALEELVREHRLETEASRTEQRRLLSEIDALRQHNKRLEKSLASAQQKADDALRAWELDKSESAKQLQAAQVQLAAAVAREQAQRDLLAMLPQGVGQDDSPPTARRKKPLRAARSPASRSSAQTVFRR